MRAAHFFSRCWTMELEVAKYGADWQIPADEIARRHDLRDQTKLRIVSIDPTTARDLDDAVHVLDCGDGTG